MTHSVNLDSTSEAGPPPTLTRKEREFLRRRLEILEAAEVVFAEKGFLAATMEEIAEKAEFSVGMLYRFFESKADLYLAVLDNRIPGLEAESHGCLDDPSMNLRSRLERYFHCRLEQYWRNPRYFRLMLQGTIALVADPRTGFLPQLLQRYERLVGRIERLFAEGIVCGEFRSANPALMALSLEGLIRAYTVRLIHHPMGERRPEEERELIRIFFEGIAR